jgi:hypothetical protein
VRARARARACARARSRERALARNERATHRRNRRALFGREWFDEKLREVALADYERNHMFEFNAMMAWLAWRPPAKICVSFQGIFTHLEIDQ